jgi:DNA damage-binding protein 1
MLLLKEYFIFQGSKMTCYARVGSGGAKYLLGDMSGRLFLLVLKHEDKEDGTFVVKDLKVEVLGKNHSQYNVLFYSYVLIFTVIAGEVSIPECISYLDNDIVFIGSKVGDSQLIKLNTTPVNENANISILETFTNLAPILDMVVVDLERHGQSYLATCSGKISLNCFSFAFFCH